MRAIIMLAILAIVFSCRSAHETGFQTIKVNINDTSAVNISTIAESYQVVPLETADTCLISRISQLQKANDYLFVIDGNSRILQFGSNGDFIRQIGRRGKGPGEYTSVGYFALDDKNHFILVSSGSQILCYDYEGKFMRSLSVDVSIESVHSFKDGNCFLATRGGVDLGDGKYANITQLYRMDKNLNITDSLLLRTVVLNNRMGGAVYDLFPFSETTAGMYFYYPVLLPEPMLRDTLYKIEENVLTPSIRLDLGMPYTFSVQNMQRNILIFKIFRTDRYFFAQYLVPQTGGFFCYDLDEQQSYTMGAGFTDDYFNTGIIQIQPLNTAQNEIYYTRDGYQLVGIIEGISESSNPVVIIVKLKD